MTEKEKVLTSEQIKKIRIYVKEERVKKNGSKLSKPTYWKCGNGHCSKVISDAPDLECFCGNKMLREITKKEYDTYHEPPKPESKCLTLSNFT